MRKLKLRAPINKATARQSPRREMSPEEETRLNGEVCQRIRHEAERFPNKWPPGQYVALLRGKIVAQAVEPEAVFRALDELEPDDRRGMVFQVGVDYDHIQEL
jgi:hypothetical protein